MLQIPIQPVPSQVIFCVLAGQNCQIAIYQKPQGVFMDLNANGVTCFTASLVMNDVPVDPFDYDGFSGNLFFIDTQGSDDPQYTGFGSRWVLIYLTASESALAQMLPTGTESIIPVLTFSETLSVTSPEAGNFSVAHGLEETPFLIEIIPTYPGVIWAQVGFADETNVYLAASAAGVTADILIYTVAASGLVVQSPAKAVLIDSPSAGNFTVAHMLGATPQLVELLPTFPGAIWFQSPGWDGTNLYLAASATGVTATIQLYVPISDAFNIEGPALSKVITSAAVGLLAFAHGLGGTPSRIEILMLSAGWIWAQSPAFDASNVYLVASDTGLIAQISVYA